MGRMKTPASGLMKSPLTGLIEEQIRKRIWNNKKVRRDFRVQPHVFNNYFCVSKNFLNSFISPAGASSFFISTQLNLKLVILRSEATKNLPRPA